MSMFTTEVRYICEYYGGKSKKQGVSGIDEIVDNSRRSIFGDYPIFDEEYRGVLEKKILKHFYTREIGEETVGLWLLRLNNKMNEIMPFYNKLYSSELLVFNPLYDVDYIRNGNRNETGHKEEEEERENEREERMNVAENNKRSASNTNENERVEIGNENRENKNKIVNEQEENGSRSFNNESESKGQMSGENQQSTTANDVKSKTQTDKYSDTPQGGLGNIDSTVNNYLTNIRKIDADESGENSAFSAGKNKGSEEREESNEGNENSSRNVKNVGDVNESEKANSIRSGNENGKSETNEEGQSVKSGNNEVNDVSKIGRNHNVSNLEDYLEHVQGKQGGGSYSKYLEEYRKTFLNIDMMIIKDLNVLFFGLWE